MQSQKTLTLQDGALVYAVCEQSMQLLDCAPHRYPALDEAYPWRLWMACRKRVLRVTGSYSDEAGSGVACRRRADVCCRLHCGVPCRRRVLRGLRWRASCLRRPHLVHEVAPVVVELGLGAPVLLLPALQVWAHAAGQPSLDPALRVRRVRLDLLDELLVSTGGGGGRGSASNAPGSVKCSRVSVKCSRVSVKCSRVSVKKTYPYPVCHPYLGHLP
jgi:hypothetical protein